LHLLVQASGDLILDSEGTWHNMALLADSRSGHQVNARF
jgi:hypothetical protein